MMGSLLNFLFIVVTATLLLNVECKLCETGVIKPFETCSDQCIQNTTCSCLAKEGTGVEHCRQYCTYFTHVCSMMTCSGGLTCNQFCGKASCNMTCENNADLCRQNCTAPGKCDIVKCSSRRCDQRCADCTMICTSEVEECKQKCLRGTCELKCAARNCIPECAANGTRCDLDTTGKVESGVDFRHISLRLIAVTISGWLIINYI